jgi:mannose-6-phosphate isomerase-like protein (cupin superfamily)
MSDMTRRDLCLTVPALAVFGSVMATLQAGGQTAGQTGAQAGAQTGTGTGDSPGEMLSHSAGYTFDALPVHHGANGMISRPVVRGTLPTGEVVELHETTLMPGQMPHPPHKHTHTEFMLFREGTVEFMHNDETTRLGPGGVAYAASEQMHGLKNVGTVPANYFVLAIGAQTNHA